MEDSFIPKAIAVVGQAIKADEEGDYQTALGLYKQSLEWFMTGLKYEKNPTRRSTIMQRVSGYMQRAEALKVSG
jgi:vacuolar protein-sorting-associated protein 4